MQQEGFRRTERQCRSKFKVLKALYLKAYVAHATSVGDPPRCPFYDTLDQLLQNQIVSDPDHLMEAAAWAKYCDQNLVTSDTTGDKGTSIRKPKRTPVAGHQPGLQTVQESDEDCQLRISDPMPEASDLEDSWDEFSGAGNSQAWAGLGSQSHLVLNSGKSLGSAFLDIILVSAWLYPTLPFFKPKNKEGLQVLTMILGIWDRQTLQT